jgi:predicted amidohydrolase
MNLLLCQPDIAWEDRPANHARVRAMLDTQPPKSGSLLILPEMFNTGFSMNIPAITETPDRPGQQFLSELARQWNISILAGLVETAPDARGYNTALLIGPDGREQVRYHKLHPFSFAGEDRHYHPGEKIVTFQFDNFTVSPFICYDLRVPEAFRAAVGRGAQLLIVIANWPASRAEHWNALLKARAIENQTYVAAVNRTGQDPRNAYAGQSQVIDPQGRIVAMADDTPQLLSATLDIQQVLNWRQKFPALNDRRNDLLPRTPNPEPLPRGNPPPRRI